MRRETGALALCLLLAACGNKGGDSGSDSGSTTVDPCFGKTVTPLPADGDTNAYYRAPVEFTMSQIETDATLTLDGVSGTQTIVGDRVVFTPDAPLAPNTAYTMTLDWSCGPTTSSFTTSAIGEPVANPADLVGKSWTLDLGGGRFVEPEGIGALVGGLLEEPLILGATAADATTLHLMSVYGSSTDVCTDRVDFGPDGDFAENPFFSAQGGTVMLDVQGAILTVENVSLSGAFSSTGDEIAGVTFGGTLDISPLTDVVGSDPCDALASIGASCDPCPDGVSQSCITVSIDSMTAAEDPATTLVCP